MAVTYERVDLSQIDFNLLRHDYTDGMYPGFPIIADWGSDPTAHVAAQVKSSLFKTMAASGLNQMNLYDTDGNVIGEITLQYKLEYVTYERVGGFGDEQTSTSGYPEYRNQGHGGDWGVKYIRVSRADNPTYDTVVTVTINGVTETRHFGQWGAIEVADYYGTLDEAWAYAIVAGSDGGPTLTLMTKTTAGVTHQYLEWSMLKGISYTTPKIDYGFEYTPRDATLLADNLSFAEHIVQEDGYVNELLNRFSPRFWTNCVGMYMIPASTGSDRSGIESVMKMLQEFDISDKLVNSWIGTDGKEYIINLRWYFGLNNSEYVKKAVDRVAMQIGPILPTEVPIVDPTEPPTYYYEDVAISEYAVWHTSELYVAPHFDNYLDMLTSYQLYLPYYGFLSLDPNDVVGARLKVYYNINLFTGHCDIIVTTKSARTNNKEEKTYSVSCVVGEDIPFTTDMYQSMGLILGQRIKEAAGVLSSYAKGDMKGMLDAVGLDSSNAKSGKTDAGTDDIDDSSDKTSTLNQVINIANSVLGTTPKPTPTPARSGNFSAETGTLEDLFPYLLVTRPISAAPSNYEEYGGIPSFKSANLGSISGFTKIAAVAPSSMTDAPKYVNEIISLLQAGVYL